MSINMKINTPKSIRTCDECCKRITPEAKHAVIGSHFTQVICNECIQKFAKTLDEANKPNKSDINFEGGS